MLVVSHIPGTFARSVARLHSDGRAGFLAGGLTGTRSANPIKNPSVLRSVCLKTGRVRRKEGGAVYAPPGETRLFNGDVGGAAVYASGTDAFPPQNDKKKTKQAVASVI